jgi:hypothetical protein
MSPTNLSAFIRAVEAELQGRGAEFDLSELICYCTDTWSMAQHNPDPSLWAGAFLKDRRIVERMREAGGPAFVHFMGREGRPEGA